MQEVFILCQQHDEHGSEEVTAFLSIESFTQALQDLKAEYDRSRERTTLPPLVCGEVDEMIADARKEQGKGPTTLLSQGWGGPHIYIVKAESI